MRLQSGERTIADLLGALRKMLGHLTARDRREVVDAIEAIHELGRRLAHAEGRLRGEPSTANPATGDLTITRAAEATADGEEAPPDPSARV